MGAREKEIEQRVGKGVPSELSSAVDTVTYLMKPGCSFLPENVNYTI